MRTVTPPPVSLVTAGTLLAAADTPAELLNRDEQHGYLRPIASGWHVYAPCADSDDDWTIGETEVDGDIAEGMPFAVIGPRAVCTVMSLTVEELEARARAGLAAVESAAIAREFWTGELATAAAVADPDWDGNARLEAGVAVTDLNPAGALSVRRALGLLEAALDDLLGVGLVSIHCARHVVPQLADYVRRDGALLLTDCDTRVIADPGYPGTSPTGAAAAAGEAWMFGTARPTVRRGPVTVDPTGPGQILDTETNRASVHAHRLALVLLPAAPVVAVRITLT